jgi:Leucine-rich repeat (LRR) protein
LPVNVHTRAVTGFFDKCFLGKANLERDPLNIIVTEAKMNTRFSLIALSIADAVLSLALVITVVGATASSVSGAATGIEQETVLREVAVNHLFAYQAPDIGQDEPMTLTEPISIYLPLLNNGYIKNYAERAALMALYNSTNGGQWLNRYGWGTTSPHCEWYGVTCDEEEHVTVLDLGGNGLTGTLPSEIGNLPMLTVLRITGTEIFCGKYCHDLMYLSGPIPAEIGNLANLRELNLWGNQLTSLPPEIGNLVNLRELYLWGNPLMTLPPEIGNLANLQVLNVASSQLTSLPPVIGNLLNLQELNVNFNQLASLHPGIGNLSSLQKLSLTGNLLTSLPREICNLVNLQSLDMSLNQLASLPPDLGNMVSLESLALSGNQITSLPLEIGNLSSLWYLDLDSNQLTSLPPEIGNLTNLGILGLGNNQLTSLPLEVGNLVHLNLLYLGGNQLTSLPEGIGNFVKLVELNLSGNRISGFIPEFLSNLDNLSYLYLDGNPDLTCWETQEARDWALSIYDYSGPTCYFPMNIYIPGCYRN